MNISRHFHAEDFGVGLSDQDIQNYHMLCVWLLDDLQDRFGIVTVLSGGRTPKHNADVGGAVTGCSILKI